MGRKPNWPPVVRLHRPSGQDRVRVGRKEYWLGPSGSEGSRRRYAELVARLTAERAAAPPEPRRGVLTVAGLVLLWDAHARERYSGAGREADQYRFALGPLVAAHGKTPADAFGDRALEDVREEMIKRGWCRSVINRRVVRVRTVWRWAERRGHAPRGSWANLRALPPLGASDRRVRQPPPRRGCSLETLEAVCACAPPKVAAMLRVGWHTGARPGEVRTMRAGEIDRTGDVWAYRPASHKNAWRGQERLIQLGPKCQEVLAPWLECRGPQDHVFEGRPGRCYAAQSYSREVRKARLRAGVAQFVAAQTRHAMKARAKREMGLDAARSMLGQASIDVCDRYDYGTDGEVAAEVARRLG